MFRTVACAAAALSIVIAGCAANSDTEAEVTTTAVSTTESTSASSSTTPSAETSDSAAPTTVAIGPDSNPETAFVTELRAASIVVRNDEGAIGTGQRMCDALTNGESVEAATAFGTEEHPWTPDEAKQAVVIAAATLCTENIGKVG